MWTMIRVTKRVWAGVGVSALTLFLSSTLEAQNPDYSLRVTNATSVDPGTAQVQVIMDSPGGAVEAFSFSLCHDDSQVLPFQATAASDLATVKNGGPPDFLQMVVDINGGVRVLCIIGLIAHEAFPPGTGFELVDVSYATIGTVGTITQVTPCSTVGNPPTQAIVVANVQGHTPILVPGTITIGFQDIDPPTGPIDPGPPGPGPGPGPGPSPGDFMFTIPAAAVSFPQSTGAASFSVIPTGIEVPSVGQPLSESQAFSLAIAHDPDYLMATAVNQSPVLAALAQGAGADFFSSTLLPGGVTLGCVYDFFAQEPIVMGSSTELCVIDYTTNSLNLAGATSTVSTDLTFAPLGSPPVNTIIVVGGESETVAQVNGTVTLSPTTGASAPFSRGDVNADGTHNVADPISLLDHLFSGTGLPLPCSDAADANGDGQVDVADPIFLLTHMFGGGPAPPAPFPLCAMPPSGNTIGCVAFGCP